jgi:hypothetical protein
MLVRKKAKACGVVLYGIVLGLVLELPWCNNTESFFRDGVLCDLPGHCAQSGGSGGGGGGVE